MKGLTPIIPGLIQVSLSESFGKQVGYVSMCVELIRKLRLSIHLNFSAHSALSQRYASS